ncbi:PfkB family carbohydrate kinase [Acuticoccus sp. MNP-M23]|uniref:PfkB family carbohydrate kinase n=1 Tax=Acuticoccus sp. MNP-M23 TaxID=3072793 RepID=UPI0028165CA8|nr:PfkB family carbohydrate kinase [Acuticoccus sp. MNP-M23]WMS43914.1 PfkB family carbohydrate kinase [Acuticoccus sp. MNP-M23]
MAVHVVGNICIDWRFALPHLPRAGETANADALSFDLGGKGALQAIATARTGASVHLWAAVGEDAEAATIRSLLEGAGLSADRLTAVDAATDRSVILVEAGGENAIVSAVAAARAFRPAMAALLMVAEPGDFLLMQNNLAPAVTEAAMAAARARGLKTVWNPSPVNAGAARLNVDLAIVNRGEGEALTGATDPAAMLPGLCERGAGAAIVTLGSGGAAVLAAADRAPVMVPVAPVAAVDTSGAGDVFCGVVVGALHAGRSLEDAARIATAAARLCVTRPGTAASIPTAAEIAALTVK